MHKWIHESHMVLNPGKCQYMLIGNKFHDDKIFLDEVEFKTSNAQKFLLVNTVIKSQFSYYPLLWMFCSRSLNGVLNQIYEHVLRLIYNDHVSSFEDFLEISNEKTIRQQNLEFFAKEIYKFVNGLSPLTRTNLFTIRENPYNLRNFQTPYLSNKGTVKFVIEIITYRDPQIWNLLPICLKTFLNIQTRN